MTIVSGIRTKGGNFRGEMILKKYSPGDGYTYNFVFGLSEDIHNAPKGCFFIAEMIGRMKTCFLERSLLIFKDPFFEQTMIRNQIECSAEMSLVIWSFLKNEFENFSFHTSSSGNSDPSESNRISSPNSGSEDSELEIEEPEIETSKPKSILEKLSNQGKHE